MVGERFEVCPLGYDCSDSQACTRMSIGMPGVHVDAVKEIGLTPNLETIDDEVHTFIEFCEGPVTKGLNEKAQDLQELVIKIDDGEEFDLVANARANMSMIDYINQREATDALSRAVSKRRKEK